MRHRPALPAALACALLGSLALAGCGELAFSGEESRAGDTSSSELSGATGGGGTSGADLPATEIPDDFPLSSGMGGPSDAIETSRTGTGLRDLELCGTAPLRGLGERDRMVAHNSGGESANTRELVLLGNPEDASALAETIADLAESCDAGTADGQPGMDILTEVRESPFAAAPAATLLQTYTFDGEPGTGATVIHVVPAGASLLVTSTYGQWTEDTLADGLASTVEPLRETVTAQAMFDDGSEPTLPEASREIAGDFPLLAGWPEDSAAEPGADNGRHGPTRTLESLEFRACGETWQEPAYVDRLRADWVNAEDHRVRQLTTYADADTAVAAVADLVARQRACPEDPERSDGFVATREVRQVRLGGGAWAILERDTLDGSRSAFGSSALVVRLGRAVLVVRQDGHAGYPSGDGQDQIDAMGSEASAAIAAMCAFTEKGC